MRHLGVLGTIVIALLATTVGDASAARAKIDLTRNDAGSEIQLKPGDELSLANDTSITINTGGGAVSCSAKEYPEEQGYRTTVETNDETTDKFEITRAYGAINGTKCPSTVPALGSTAYVRASVFNKLPFGTLSLGSNLKAELKAKSKTEGLVYEVDFSGGADCIYSFTSAKGTITGEETEFSQKLEVLFENQKMKLYKPSSSKSCPKTATLTAPFQYALTDASYDVFFHILP